MGIKKTVVSTFNRVKYKSAKHAPTIFFVAGLALDAFALYSFIKKSGKVVKIVEKHNATIDALHDIPVVGEEEEHEGDFFESEKEKNKAIRHQYIDTVGEVAKEVAIPAAAWIGSKACYFHCKNILNARYLGAVGLYEATKANFNKYRQRNIELNGAEADDDCMYGKATDICEMAPEEEGGEVTKTSVRFPENAIKDICTVWIDEESSLYNRDRLITEDQIRRQETWVNRKCAAKGFVDLYYIIEALGKADSLTGEEILLAKSLGKVWNYDKSDAENWVSFGIDDPVNADKRNPVLTLHISGMDILENVMPKKKQIGLYASPLPFH